MRLLPNALAITMQSDTKLLSGRLPSARVERFVMQASENLHRSPLYSTTGTAT